ncbi:MAG: LacI family DNA-binding transcriptional regulator [Acidimicrobiia bacterium]|nr:LacI family DNA-binding transcriptional regulator [Acidimicrobiia bacterium]
MSHRRSTVISDVTLKHIASSLGVNASTVSRALDPAKSHLVSEEMVAQVRQAASELGYRGDRVAGAMRRGATGTVGVIVADLANPFIAPVIHGIAQSLATEQMLPMIVETNDDPAELASSVDHLLSRRVDAVICAGARFENREVLEQAAVHTPLIIAVRGLPNSVLTQVLHDDRAGGAMAARHLLERGHKRVAELRGPDDVGNFVARHQGFQDECGIAAAEAIDLPSVGARPIRAEGERLAQVLLDEHGDNLPTAVFAHNDLMAVGALSVFREHGLSCPDDISIVAYNNSPMIDQVDPPLTSVVYPGIEVGRAAGDVSLHLISQPEDRAAGAIFPPTMCIRDSAKQL